MPKTETIYKCDFCNAEHKTEDAAKICEHGHIFVSTEDSVTIRYRGIVEVYKYVPPPPQPVRTKEQDDEWEHDMILGSRCG